MNDNAPSPLVNSYGYQSYQRQRQLTLGDLLLENRIVFLQGEIYTGNANEVVCARNAAYRVECARVRVPTSQSHENDKYCFPASLCGDNGLYGFSRSRCSAGRFRAISQECGR